MPTAHGEAWRGRASPRQEPPTRGRSGGQERRAGGGDGPEVSRGIRGVPGLLPLVPLPALDCIRTDLGVHAPMDNCARLRGRILLD